jgi:hypothetical protein
LTDYVIVPLQDLEKLIGKSVDTSKADYAVITGVQVHNWARSLDNPGSYSMEFVAPSSCYAVVNGVATHLDLSQIPQVREDLWSAGDCCWVLARLFLDPVQLIRPDRPELLLL